MITSVAPLFARPTQSVLEYVIALMRQLPEQEKVMEKCYEYLGCDKSTCIMHQVDDNTPCWKVEGTQCNHRLIEQVRERFPGTKEELCAFCGCIYYKEAHEAGWFRNP